MCPPRFPTAFRARATPLAILLVLAIQTVGAHGGTQPFASGGAEPPEVIVRVVEEGREDAIISGVVVSAFAPIPNPVNRLELKNARETAFLVHFANTTVFARAPGFWTASAPLDEAAAARGVVEMTLAPREPSMERFQVVVAGARGEALSGVLVHALWRSGDRQLLQEALTGDAGEVSFELPGIGNVTAWTESDFFEPTLVERPMEASGTWRMALAPRSVTRFVEGVVEGADGAPRSGLAIFAQSPLGEGRALLRHYVVTDEQGRFFFPTFGGPMSLVARDGSVHRLWRVEAPADANLTTTLALAPTAHESLVRIVAKDEGGAPVEGARVHLTSMDNPSLGHAGRTDARGEYLAVLPRGRVAVAASCSECGNGLGSRSAFVTVGQEALEVPLVLRPVHEADVVIEGAVRSADGAPVARAHAAILDRERGSVVGLTQADVEGRFRLHAYRGPALILLVDGPAPQGSDGPLAPFLLPNGHRAVAMPLALDEPTVRVEAELPRGADGYVLRLEFATDGRVEASYRRTLEENLRAIEDVLLGARYGRTLEGLLQPMSPEEAALIHSEFRHFSLEKLHLVIENQTRALPSQSKEWSLDGDGRLVLVERGEVADPALRGERHGFFATVPPHLQFRLEIVPPPGHDAMGPEGARWDAANGTLVWEYAPAAQWQEVVFPFRFERPALLGGEARTPGFEPLALLAVLLVGASWRRTRKGPS